MRRARDLLTGLRVPCTPIRASARARTALRVRTRSWPGSCPLGRSLARARGLRHCLGTHSIPGWERRVRVRGEPTEPVIHDCGAYRA